MIPVLAILFLALPVAELTVILLIGREIGPWWTIALLILAGVVGSWLAKREGVVAWRRFTRALDSGRMPHNEIIDGALILLAAALMVTPGFLSDVLGILLLLPPSRAVARRAVVAWVARRAARHAATRLGLGQGPVIDADARPAGGPSGSTKVRWGDPEPPVIEPDERR